MFFSGGLCVAVLKNWSFQKKHFMGSLRQSTELSTHDDTAHRIPSKPKSNRREEKDLFSYPGKITRNYSQ
jgi:hypothetical protein